MARYRAKQEFEHYPSDVDPAKPQSVVVKEGDTVDNIHPDSIQGLLDSGVIEEVGAKKASGGDG